MSPRAGLVFAVLLTALATPAPAQTVPPGFTLVRAVLLMRHGVRPPTHEPALDPAIAPSAWPAWDVPDGYLTAHGAAAIQLLGAYDRQVLAPGAACPDVTIYTDVDERTVKTGEAFAAGYAPGCALPVGHAAGAKDPLFSALDDGAAAFDANAAQAAMLAAAGGDVAAPVAKNRALFATMQSALAPGDGAFLKEPAAITVKNPHKLPKLTGPIADGASGAEVFLLEYLDGKPMRDVAWGRLDATGMLRLLALHPLAYTMTARPAVIAAATARPLAERIVSGLRSGPRLTVLVGHDTNQAELGGYLNLHWSLGGYPADDPPPGGGLIFALLQDKAGQQFVSVTYQVQTPNQIRDLIPLAASHPPATQVLRIPACGNSTAPNACPLAQFTALAAH